MVRQTNTVKAQGRKVNVTPGTELALSSTSVPCQMVKVTALESNQNIVVVGNSGVVAGSDADTAGTRTGTPLQPNQPDDFVVNNVNKLYLDAVVSGDGVSWVALD